MFCVVTVADGSADREEANWGMREASVEMRVREG